MASSVETGDEMLGAADYVVDAPTRASGASAAAPSARRGLRGRLRRRTATEEARPETSAALVPAVDIAPNDPILSVFHSTPGVVDLRSLTLESPALDAMRETGVVLVVPLVTSGELVGLLQLGPRLSERDYSRDDRQLLESLARYAAPALRLGQLVREQEAEARSRERIEQELKVAQLIQQQFLPKSLPDMPNWHLSAFYRPARTVGGDFYDFFPLGDGRVMVVTGDVTDKGVPAALVMASTHALLRETGPRLADPSAVLARVNDLLCEDIPAHMFVTCLAMVIDPSGAVEFANAGHNLPFVRAVDGTVRELRATGMPLGLMPGMGYESSQARVGPGEQLLLYSDGLTEQHNSEGEMFGFPRTRDVLGSAAPDVDLTDLCVGELARFTGPDVEQEDDITLVSLRRTQWMSEDVASDESADRLLGSFEVPSEPGNERQAMARVAELVADLWLDDDQRERLKTAVAETTMNAIEHGNRNQPEIPVLVSVTEHQDSVTVSITDFGGRRPEPEADQPDLDLKLAGLQTPRGWGLFLVKNMVDGVDEESDQDKHIVHLLMRRQETGTVEPQEATT